MDTKYEKYILTIANEKNMTRAAKKLYISQSSLSYYLTKLESELGTPLFFRKKNELTPTRAGRLYVDACRRIVDIHEELKEGLAQLNEKTNIVISSTSIWGMQVFSEIIPKLKNDFPDISFSLSQTDITFLQEALDEGKIDMALLSIGPKNKLTASMEILRQEEVYLAVPENHPYALAHPDDTEITEEAFAEAFQNEHFLLSHKGTANHDLADRLFSRFPKEAGYQVYDVNGIPLTLSMVTKEMGVSLIPRSGRLKDYPVRYFSFVPKLHRYNAIFYNQAIPLNKPEKVFLHYVRDYMKYAQ
ncbi:MAG: LysR family transcriptional regulator [Lachnospiraceae bacterium]|nr:LysR family transcriptional regulator [Lachnospiraceae bacterium]